MEFSFHFAGKLVRKNAGDQMSAAVMCKLRSNPLQNAIIEGNNINEADQLGYIHYAALDGELPVLEMLLKHGSHLQEEMNSVRCDQVLTSTPSPETSSASYQSTGRLFAAIPGSKRSMLIGWSESVQVVKFLLDRGAEIESQDSEGHTPLMKSAQYNQVPRAAGLTRFLIPAQVQTCQFLLARGARVDTEDIHGHQVEALLNAPCHAVPGAPLGLLPGLRTCGGTFAKRLTTEAGRE
eukprot:767376-Hanusia_phi.AAC.4